MPTRRPLQTDPGAAERVQHGQRHSLASKFRCAFRGLKRGIRGESNFFVHFFAAAGVIAAGAVLEVTRTEWCLLALAIAAVLAAEMFNTAVEMLAKAVTDHFNPHVEDALDTASASVLLAVCGAVAVGLVIFGSRLGHVLGAW